MAEAAANERRGSLSGRHLGDHAGHLPGDEAVRLLVRMQQRFDLAAQLVVIAASLIKEGRAPRRLQFQSSVVKPADLAPAVRVHVTRHSSLTTTLLNSR